MNDKGPAVYEDIYNILFISYGLDAPDAEDRFVSLLDLAPTFLKTAGVVIPSEYDGRSLFDLYRDEESGRDAVRAEFHGHQYPYEQRMIRDGRYKPEIGRRYHFHLIPPTFPRTNRITLQHDPPFD